MIMPYEVAGKQSVSMLIQFQQSVSNSIVVGLTDTVHGLFSADASGTGVLAAFNSNGTLNTRTNPAMRGEIVSAFATGEGLTDPLPANGELAGSSPPKPRRPVSVLLQGLPATVIYQGGVPAVTAGLLQVNFRIPDGVRPGLLSVQLSTSATASQSGGTIAVQ